MLPVRIELTTSALPRMRSTTELRQQLSGRARLWRRPRRASTQLAGRTCARHVAEMTSKDKEREERLAAALRENLKRRKAQARATKPESDEPAD